jgi:hypothetical protein
MNELYTLLIGYFSILSSATVIRANQNAPAPSAPYLTLNIQSVQPTGSYRTAIDTDGTQDVTRSYAFTLDINFYGKKNGQVELEALVDTVLDGLEDHNKRLFELAGKIALQEVIQPPTDVSALFGEQWQPRYNIALRMHTSRAVEYTSSFIDDVAVSKTWRTA